MNSFILGLVLCLGDGNNNITIDNVASQCDMYDITVTQQEYTYICSDEFGGTDSDWMMLDDYMVEVATEVNAPELFIDSIDCKGE